MRSLLRLIVAFGLLAPAMAEPPATVMVTLPEAMSGTAGGRLLVFAEPATPANAGTDTVDFGPSQDISVLAADVRDFTPRRAAAIDIRNTAYPKSFAELAPGDYRVQAVLDRNGDYNYAGRASGDVVSNVVTLHFPLASAPTIPLEHVIAAEPAQFDTTGLPPVAAAQILASQPHLHDEHIPSRLLTRFHGAPRTIAAWVLTPPGYDPNGRETYPTVFTAGGFGATHRLDGQQLSRQWHLMETGAIPPMIWVALDYATPQGTTEFADSANNGPWGRALVEEVIPALEARYRMDARPSGRFLTGHSSGGWFALWAMVRYPAFFGGAWPTSPDPSDFHDFLGVDIYAPGANMYHDAAGAPRPLERSHGQVKQTIEQLARLETVLGHDGGQLRSFEWVFSPRRADGTPALLFDRGTGAIDPAVAAYWRDHYDIARRVETEWPRLKGRLDGKIHLTVGAADSYYLDGPARRLEAALRRVGAKADFTFVPDATHSMREVYARDGDRDALWKAMTASMLAIARPDEAAARGRRAAP